MEEDLNDDEKSILAQIRAIVGKAVFDSLSRQDRAALLDKLSDLPIQRLGPKHKAYRNFIKRMMNRQGTFLPDFESFYDQKAELDFKLFGRNAP